MEHWINFVPDLNPTADFQPSDLAWIALKAMAFSPDGSLIATVNWDRTLKVFDAATGDMLSPTLNRSTRSRCTTQPPGN